MPEQPPYHGYATIMGAFLAGLGAVSGLAAARRQPHFELEPIDLALLGLATFKASRTVARDKVTSFVREPFVEGEAIYGEEDQQPTHDTEMKQAIGELRHLHPLYRDLDRRRSRGDAGPRTAHRPPAHLGTRSGRYQRFSPAGFGALTAKANELEQRAGGSSQETEIALALGRRQVRCKPVEPSARVADQLRLAFRKARRGRCGQSHRR